MMERFQEQNEDAIVEEIDIKISALNLEQEILDKIMARGYIIIVGGTHAQGSAVWVEREELASLCIHQRGSVTTEEGSSIESESATRELAKSLVLRSLQPVKRRPSGKRHAKRQGRRLH